MLDTFRVEAVVPTKDRYENLALLLWSFLEQTYKHWDLTIIDDSENRSDIRELSYITPILKRLEAEGHQWRVNFGDKKGPHYCHQKGLLESRHPYIFRVDDDCILDSKALEYLVTAWQSSKIEKIGAVGPIIFDPSIDIPFGDRVLPVGYKSFKKFQGKVDKYGETFGEQQWCYHPDKDFQNVEHLYSSFLYSKKAAEDIGGYELGYNVVGHREETDFSYRLFKKGYSLLIQPSSLVWHLRSPRGGIRTFDNGSLWEDCHELYLRKFGFKRGKNKDRVVKIFGGLGDHLCATPLIRGLKKKGKVVVSSVYPYIFQGNPNIDELIFTSDEKDYDKIDFRDVYKWTFDNNFRGSLSQAFCECFDIITRDDEKLDYFIYPQERECVNKKLFELKCGANEYVLIAPYSGVPVIQYMGTTKIGAGGKRTSVKDWFDDRWEALVKGIKKTKSPNGKWFRVFQVGGPKDRKINGCDAYFLGQDYRESMALLEQSVGLISVDSFMQHGAFAIGKKSVVLFGSSDPKIFGHDFHDNIYYPEACQHNKECLRGSPWLTQLSECKYLDCMNKITVKEVLDMALKNLLKEKKIG